MSLNLYRPVQSLQKSPPATGGMCGLTIFKVEDVLAWPAASPLTGIISDAVQLKPGKSFYLIQAAEKGRNFNEEQKSDAAGPYSDIVIEGSLRGHNSANILSLQSAAFHRWGAIVPDRSGCYRLIGDEDSGAQFFWKYGSGDATTSRKTEFTLKWQPAMPAPLYQAAVFTITIGGVTVTVGRLTLLMRFWVGFGAPIAEGQENLQNNAFAGTKLLVLVNGSGLPCDDGSGDPDFTGSLLRHYEKTDASDTIHFVGGVINGELIEIYAYA